MPTIAEVATAALLVKLAEASAARAAEEQLLSDMTQGLLEAFLGEPVELMPCDLDLDSEVAVYKDADGLCLSVTSSGEVRVVVETDHPGEWQEIGGPYEDVAELGAALAEQQPGLNVIGQA